MLEQRAAAVAPAAFVAARLRARNPLVRSFFAREAGRVSAAAAALAQRFSAGGRLFAFGRGAYSTDAAHVAVEFVHPVIVGKRALPALDASSAYDAMLEHLAGPADAALGFGPPAGDPAVLHALANARRRGVLTFALPGGEADYAFASPTSDAHIHQEIFEILGHTLYESVHVFLEHEPHLSADAGAAGFLYPFLGAANAAGSVDEGAVARSIVAKALAGEQLREHIAERAAYDVVAAARCIAQRIAGGGRLLTFGNGGSATDATDFALDCLESDSGLRAVPAFSLAAEPAVLSAIGNDVGMELTFVRQLIAQGRPGDVAFAFSTSGGSKNVVAALVEARARGLATIALLGYDGGEIARRGLADHTLVVDCADIPRIQETQAALYHVLRETIDLVRDGA